MPHRAHPSSTISKPSTRLRPNAIMVTITRGTAIDKAMQLAQMHPGAALTISQIVGHITVLIALGAYRCEPTTATETSSTVPTAIHTPRERHAEHGTKDLIADSAGA